MRLNRLDLTRYGKFTDRQIDFGSSEPGRPDLHIVYGPNEAGKSTALAAFLDLLFGIEARSRYDFLHPYATMRIGASLDLASGTRAFVRIKRPQNSLLDGGEQPVPDGLILGDLGAIDRASYRTMFSLDDDTLEAGGESILASKGDLGQLLFSASAGLAELSRTLVALRGEADGFYRFRARSGELHDLKAQLATLKEERERIDTAASEYAQLVETRDRASVQYEEALGERGQVRSRMDEIRRLVNAMPRLAALKALRADLEPLAGLPEPPPGWLESLPRLQAEEIELATRADAIDRDIDRVTDEIEAIAVDEHGLRLAERADRLAELRARSVTAEKDLPLRHLQLKEIDLAISGILRRLECPEQTAPGSLLLAASQVGALRSLIEQRSGVEAALNGSRREWTEAGRRLADLRERLGAAGPDDQPGAATAFAALAGAVNALRADDHLARRRIAERTRANLLDVLAERLSALKPWSGKADELAAISVPAAYDIERWKAATAEAQAEIDRHGSAIERLTTERRRLEAERDSIGATAGPVSDQEAAAIRAAREAAWARHRRALDATSADAYEGTLRRDDAVVHARFGNAKDVARLHQLTQAIAVLIADLDRAGELHAVASGRMATLRAEIAAALRAIGPAMPPDMSLSHLEAWLAARERILDLREQRRQADRDLREAETDAAAARERLLSALAAAGTSHDAAADLDALALAAQTAIDREAGKQALRDQADERRRDLARRDADMNAAAAAERDWSQAWEKACAGSWLGRGGIPGVATVRECLVELAALEPVLDKRSGLADRIQKMEHDQAAFADEVAALAGELGMDDRSRPSLDLAHDVAHRVEAARAAEATRATRMTSLDDLRERQRDVVDRIAVNARRKIEMTGYFDVTSLIEVGERLRSAEKKADLQRREIDEARALRDAIGETAEHDAEALLEGLDRPALETELGELTARFEDLDRRARELFTAHSKAVDRVEAVGGDDAVARLEERRRTGLLEIEDKALRHFRLRVGIVAAEQALRSYRDRHRSSMMKRASEAFRTISRGAYTGLATQPEKDGEILLGVGADGSSKIASDMSKGTRFQLYLALRVAGYHEFARLRPAVPFVADDIMETFDDFRAEEAFRVFSDMAEVGQVIYLTHHRHLLDIAQRVCPGVRVHELGPGPG
ncbi:ATP-binding protein [Phreatobacter stygius]|uniref:YhaN AAA domain-containing protein n=1 Tax=Phreatobacter stygius TaxID=1940610 RepID=A0A4D7B7X2_9HYPH|nr:AAA family ATPase [Phreatobacter stygius]QCI64232.1 hypothetical protein E8M01_08220 [Phreatobacter stygius]